VFQDIGYERKLHHHDRARQARRQAVHPWPENHGSRRAEGPASGMKEDDVLADFPDLTRDDIRAYRKFATGVNSEDEATFLVAE
jgi:hypothetical protein